MSFPNVIGFAVIASSVTMSACGAVGEHLSVGGSANGLTSDGGELHDAGVGASPVLLHTDFEGSGECASWVATNAVVTTVPGRTGSGCMLCATKTVSVLYMSRDIVLPQLVSGVYEIDSFAKLVVGNEASTVLATSMFIAAVDEPHVRDLLGGASASGRDWNRGRSDRGIWTPRGETTVTISLGAVTGHDASLAAGDCIAFDDVTVSVTPDSLPSGPDR